MAWLRFEKKGETCCQNFEEDDLEPGEEACFDCASCPVRQKQASLTEEHRLALDLYDILRYQVVADLHLVPLVFDVFGLRMTRTSARTLLDYLEVIHRDAVEAGAGPRDPDDTFPPLE